MKYYAILDTNVLVSALLKTGSVPGQVAAEAMHGDIIPILNDEIIAEYEDVLRRPKFHFDSKAVTVFLDELKKRAVYSDYGLIDDEIPDAKDVVFYAVLMEKRNVGYPRRWEMMNITYNKTPAGSPIHMMVSRRSFLTFPCGNDSLFSPCIPTLQNPGRTGSSCTAEPCRPRLLHEPDVPNTLLGNPHP
jgi:hypothetical protein